jgi:predicted lipoprotein with Yx(FWY)xxD motif
MKVLMSVVAGLAALVLATAGHAKAPAADIPVPAEVLAHPTDAGWTFSDTEGKVLYTFEQDPPGKSACGGPPKKPPDTTIPAPSRGMASDDMAVFGCTSVWSPLAAPAEAKPLGKWQAIKREDGTLQWAFANRPLYTYKRDLFPGATFGDGLQTQWSVAFEPIPTPPDMRIFSTVKGRVLANAKGQTLYFRGTAKGQKGMCTGTCLQTWTPLNAPLVANRFGDFSAVMRPDGTAQWAYKDRPLYVYRNEGLEGATDGDGIDNLWRAAILGAPPPLPSWVTIQNSDRGRVLANEKGRTIYVFSGHLERVKSMSCNDECIQKNWEPVIGDPKTTPMGNWAVVSNPDGGGQWTYKGDRVYLFKRDTKPGKILGDGFGSGYGPAPAYQAGWWRLIVASCMCSPGTGE